MAIRALILTFTAVFTSAALAFPLPSTSPALKSLPETFTTNFDFEGIVKLSNCSGSLIRFEHSLDSDAGWVLTNGHCLEGGMPRPNEVITHRPSSRSFALLRSDSVRAGRAQARELVYATMTGTDMALYRLTQTYAELQRLYGVRPLTLSSQHPNTSQAIEVISGYWERGYRCAIDTFVHQLQESGWTFADSLRYSRPGCEVIPGTSGSPILASGTRTVIGINNTGNMDGRRCTLNNPCEVDENGNVSFQRGLSYGQQTYWVYDCLNDARELDLNQPSCKLAKPAAAAFAAE
jgi:V8-like Glu-specific endopeptidase